MNIEIRGELRQADTFVALFNPAYLASQYCWDIEYKRAMGRRARKLMRVVAVVVKPCAWKQTRAVGFKLLPKDGLPPERWSSSDADYLDAARHRCGDQRGPTGAGRSGYEARSARNETRSEALA